MSAGLTNRVYNVHFHTQTTGEAQMYQQIDILFDKFRFALGCIAALASLVIISALVTAIGSHSVLDQRTHSSTEVVDTAMSNSPNTVTDGLYRLADSAKQLTVAIGSVLYGACRSITTTVSRTGQATVRVGMVMVHGVGSGMGMAVHAVGTSTMFVARASSNGIMFVVRMPGKVVGSIRNGHVVGSVIRPADDDHVPVISDETSAAALARFSAAQEEEIAKLQAAQVLANQKLGGLVVAGDPNHGGYPAKWDAPVRQDSQVDSWGMYSRECVSYAAWKVYQTYGTMPYWGGMGNANQWVRDARNSGVAIGSTPQVHSVAISLRGYYGHAMWVEKTSGDMIYVSQYNYDLHGHYSEMWINGSSLTYIYFK